MQSHFNVSVGRDLGTSTACHHLAAFCLLFNKNPLNKLYEPISVHGGVSASSGLPCCLLSSVQQKSAEQTLRTHLCPWRRLHPLAFGSGGELIWHSHTLSCGYARLEGSMVHSQVQSEDKLQVSGVALSSYM